ncbi:DsbA family protein [Patescibacteria group bacterium]|nr:DsbA family protein [Patescibacteria group bacterium]
MPFEKKQTKFITESPKLNFFFGLIIGVAVISLIGFGVVAGKLDGNNKQNQDNSNKQEVAGEQNPEALVVDLKIDENDHFLGNKDASVKIFVFSDFQCPYCARHHETLHQIAEEYGDKIAWVFKQFPIASHPLGMHGALASECAGEQGKFWEMADMIFENQQTLTAESFDKFADDLNLNVDEYKNCVVSEKYKEKILTDYNLGVESGVRGTPSNFINNEMVPGAVPYENIKSIIDDLLK